MLTEKVQIGIPIVLCSSDACPTGGGFVAWTSRWHARIKVKPIFNAIAATLQLSDDEYIIALAELLVAIVGSLLEGEVAGPLDQAIAIGNTNVVAWFSKLRARPRGAAPSPAPRVTCS